MKYGILTVVKELESKLYTAPSGKVHKRRQIECLCECGIVCVKERSQLTTGKTKSCGCLRVTNMKTHGHSQNNKLYGVWASQKTRCRNPKDLNYDKYGERSITFSKKFDEFEDWYAYVSQLDNAEKERYTLDRINNDKGYKIGNLRWATHSVQQANRGKTIQNKSGYKGVWELPNGKYRARVQHKGVGYHIGCYSTAKKASKAYNKYVKKHKLPHKLN